MPSRLFKEEVADMPCMYALDSSAGFFSDSKSVATLLAAVIAAAASVWATFQARRNQRSQERFQRALAEQTSHLQRDTEGVKSNLERSRRYGEGMRQRIWVKLDEVESAAVAIGACTRLSEKVSWVEDKGISHVCELMDTAIYSARFGLNHMGLLGVLADDDRQKCVRAVDEIEIAWMDVLGHLTRKFDVGYRSEHPEDPFNRRKYNAAADVLKLANARLHGHFLGALQRAKSPW
ncbi:hypothetical protein ACFCX3_06015 [Streptomyces virginiae]|uniref:hypothetical protein n=1 Tax=Streptomyces virginiae TaxID=1961 RepID=UPI0035DCB0AC